MSFVALASQGQIAAQHHSPAPRNRKKTEKAGEKKMLTETEKITIRQKYANGQRIIDLIREYKVPANQIRRALGL